MNHKKLEFTVGAILFLIVFFTVGCTAGKPADGSENKNTPVEVTVNNEYAFRLEVKETDCALELTGTMTYLGKENEVSFYTGPILAYFTVTGEDGEKHYFSTNTDEVLKTEKLTPNKSLSHSETTEALPAGEYTVQADFKYAPYVDFEGSSAMREVVVKQTVTVKGQ